MPEQFKAINEKVNAAVAIKEDYERMKTTDPVKGNEKLVDEKKSRFSSSGKQLFFFIFCS